MSRERLRTRTLPERDAKETNRPRRKSPVTVPEPADIPLSVQDRDQVQVISGANVQSFPLAGLQVGHARTLVEALLAVQPNAPTLVNGRTVESDHILQSCDTLEFVHHAGEKGHV